MRLTLIGILTGLVLCEAVHGFDAADLNSVSSAIQGSTQDVLLGAGRSMRGLKALHKVGYVRVCVDGCIPVYCAL